MSNDLFFKSILGFLLGGYSFFKGFSYLKKKRFIENIPTSKIRSLAMGVVEIYGSAVPIKNKIIKSPFSQKDCVYSKYTIEEYRRSGKSSRWVTVKSRGSITNFHLRDDTGAVLINPEGANIEIPFDFEYNSGWGKDPPETVKQFLKNNGMSFEGFLGINKTMRYREYIIAPGDKLYIMGTAGANPFVEAGTSAENAGRIMIQKGEDEKLYFISDSPEKEVLKDIYYKMTLAFMVGVPLTIFSLLYILYALNIIRFW